MKQRFSSLDIKVIAHELSQTLPTLRVSNIYDLSSRIFLFKFAKPSHKASLIVDSGFRCHLTAFTRTTEAAPSPFVTRLRKFLKTRRVTKVSQVGTDRILELQFSEGQYRLFLEFYAGGNIVLTDGELKVLTVLRNVNEGAEHEHVRVGSTYNLSERQNIDGIPDLTTQRIKDGLQKWIERQVAAESTQGGKHKRKSKGGDVLRKALAGCINEYPPLLLEHALQVTGFDTTLLPEAVVADDVLLQGVLEALKEAGRTMDKVMSHQVAKGYIIGKSVASSTNSESPGQEKIMYNDFHPFLPHQFASDPSLKSLEFEGFNHTVDEFFSSIEGQKLESRLAEKEEAARKKLEHAKLDQEKRIGGLQEVQALNVRKAQAIEANLDRVEEAAAAINSLISQGMDWVEIDRLIGIEQKRQNPVAEIIKLPLKLSDNTATLLLGEWNTEEDEEEGYFTGSEPSDSEDDESPPKKSDATKAALAKPQENRLAVDIDLGLSGWSNAREYYDQKKTAAAKQEKTVAASTKALKSATVKVEADLKKALKQEKAILQPTRQAFWFEKFIYFISSDGYLVLGGKDAMQSEILYKRHMKKGDVFVHADLNGACPMIIKNNASTPDAPIPPGTLSQAGNMSVATSSAWDSKAVMSAWWVPADKVTKNASTGDYLPSGKFDFRGEKTFLPPAQLLLGFAVLFQVSDASKAKHTKHHLRDEPTGSKVVNDEIAEVANPDGTQEEAAKEAKDEDTQEDDVTVEADEAHAVNENSDDESSDDANEQQEDQADDDDDDQPKASYNNPLQAKPSLQQSENPAIPNPIDSAEDSDDAGEDNDDEDEEVTETASTAAPSVAASTSTSSQPKPNIPVRGKRGKKKKMATKYADQDDADRAEAMELLGSRAGQERAAAAAAALAAAKADAEAQKARRTAVMERRIREGRAREEARLHADDAGAGDDADDDGLAAQAVDLDALVGTPLPGDELVAALPVCAPWASLARCKYKAKMQPGAQKKGKAVREILGAWAAAGQDRRALDERAEDVERIWPREIELVRAWKETEVFNVVPVSKVRVMMAGGSGGGSAKGGGKGQKGGGRGGRGSKKR
ncbi:hypothetical protein FH972_023074 [Carpinus fangiana]|uniref:Ribosome quality control complex subunit 2 n=1 Tax=Carpinus fangiana TaxID=176857 RepID=A0A5N6KUD4_9ROSI|nr:hypothetical protein FH972_023074 [Carpinus fangiana]